MKSNIKIFKRVIIGKNSSIGEFTVIGILSKKDKEKKTIIGNNCLIRSHAVVYAGNVIGDNFQTGHGVLIREDNKIGNNVSVGSHTVIEHHVSIGNNVRIHSGAFIPEYSILEDNVWIGPHVILTNAKYPASKNTKKLLKGPTIKKCAIIGAGSVILPGVTIGEKCLIGAGSVVVKNIPCGKVAVGNPARVIKEIKDLGCYQ